MTPHPVTRLQYLPIARVVIRRTQQDVFAHGTGKDPRLWVGENGGIHDPNRPQLCIETSSKEPKITSLLY
jgi:hypothetical protein